MLTGRSSTKLPRLTPRKNHTIRRRRRDHFRKCNSHDFEHILRQGAVFGKNNPALSEFSAVKEGFDLNVHLDEIILVRFLHVEV